MNNRIALLKGGTSEERDVSIHTCEAVEKALLALGKTVLIFDPSDYVKNEKINYIQLAEDIKKAQCDRVFIGLHGGDGENGTFQKLFELAGIPYVGSDADSSFICMSKKISKLIARDVLNIPVPRALFYKKNEEVPSYKNVSRQLDKHLVVKPNASGSSVGVTILDSENEFNDAVEYAFSIDNDIIIEQYIPGREITVAMLGDRALPVVEIKPKNGFYDYKNKYTENFTVYETPAHLSSDKAKCVTDYALRIYREFGCSHYARIDFRYDGDKFYFLEVNTLPGMTSLSLVPMAAQAVGMDFEELIRRLIEQDFSDL
ncbi:MAG: D-alanine--D-alanine ligase [Candidatus Cloacimonetes bacterium]|nr:D-alanine--D-alanine ligase [Candidatus Cloacimonadota bacterium]